MPMDSTHEALLDRVLVSSDANYRHEALTKTISLMVPDLGFLDWPEVITVRNMPKIRALRAKIFEIQTEAFLRSRRDRSALLDEVASTVTTVLFETVQELRPKPLRAIAKFMLEFLPFSHLLIAAAEGGELVKDALSWHAVVLRMRSISEGART